jgi:hypothetical protein
MAQEQKPKILHNKDGVEYQSVNIRAEGDCAYEAYYHKNEHVVDISNYRTYAYQIISSYVDASDENLKKTKEILKPALETVLVDPEFSDSCALSKFDDKDIAFLKILMPDNQKIKAINEDTPEYKNILFNHKEIVEIQEALNKKNTANSRRLNQILVYTPRFIEFLSKGSYVDKPTIEDLESAYSSFDLQNPFDEDNGKEETSVSEVSDDRIAILKDFANNDRLVKAFIEYDIKQKGVSSGYGHACTLKLLAVIENKELHIWKDDKDKIVEIDEKLGGRYIPLSESKGRIDLHFTKATKDSAYPNHYNRLIKPQLESEKKSEKTPKKASSSAPPSSVASPEGSPTKEPVSSSNNNTRTFSSSSPGRKPGSSQKKT